MHLPCLIYIWYHETNEPNYNDASFNLKSIFPVAAGVGVGGRYYYTANIGDQMKFGLGSCGLL